MSQKNPYGWIIVDIFWFFLWSFIGFFVILQGFSMDSTFAVLFWISGAIGLAVILALKNKYPSLRIGVRSFVLPFVVFTLVDGAMYGFVAPQLYSLSNPNFKVLDMNDTFNSSTGSYVFYAQIRNDGIDGYMTVYCEVKKEDLTTTVKSQRLYLEHNQIRTIQFSFAIYGDLGGKLVDSYRFSFRG